MIKLEDVFCAQDNIKNFVEETAVIQLKNLSNLLNSKVYVKLENMQNTGSFKMRGACNKIANLTPEEKSRGIITSSAGNHAQGVAASGKAFGVKTVIVMPKTTPITKIKATKDYGAEVILHGEVYDDAYQKALEIQKERNLVFVHPFDDELVIAGQGTIALEIIKQVEDIDVVVIPVGGGGLISGVSYVLKTLKPNIRIIGVQTLNAQAMKISFDNKELTNIKCLPSIADGIAVSNPGKKTYELISKYVDEIVTVSEDQIASAILELMENYKIVTEGSGAATVAALRNNKIKGIENKKVLGIVSGGNIDISVIESIINKGLINDGRRFQVSLKLKHKSGELQKLLQIISDLGGNVYAIEQSRYDKALDVREQQVIIIVESFDEEHKNKIINEIIEKGYSND